MSLEKARELITAVRFLRYESTVKDKISRYRDLQELEFISGTVLEPDHYPRVVQGFDLARKLPNSHDFWNYTTREELEATYKAFKNRELFGNYDGFGRGG